MKLHPGMFSQSFMTFAVGAVISIGIAAALLLLYRLVAADARTYSRDVIGTTAAAISGSLGMALADFINKTGGSGTKGLGGDFNNVIAGGACLAFVVVGLILARRFAGFQSVRSMGSDVVPFGGAAVLGAICVALAGVVRDFS